MLGIRCSVLLLATFFLISLLKSCAKVSGNASLFSLSSILLNFWFSSNRKRGLLPYKEFFAKLMFLFKRVIKSAGLSLLEQKFHFSDGTIFRISATRFWTEVTICLLYNLIEAKETFESDQYINLKYQFLLWTNLKPLELSEIILNYRAIRIWGELFCFYMRPILTLKQLVKLKRNFSLTYFK